MAYGLGGAIVFRISGTCGTHFADRVYSNNFIVFTVCKWGATALPPEAGTVGTMALSLNFISFQF